MRTVFRITVEFMENSTCQNTVSDIFKAPKEKSQSRILA